jgi:hypothetical protein
MVTTQDNTTTTDNPVTIPPRTVETPQVWEMPTTGVEWCVCGDESHVVSRDRVLLWAAEVVKGWEWMTHDEVIMIAMDMWNYESVCEFFLMKVRDCAVAVHGEVAQKYPFETGLEIIGYFMKTWHGCPELACEGGDFDRW